MRTFDDILAIILEKMPPGGFLYSGFGCNTERSGRSVLLISHELSLTGAPIVLQNTARVLLANGDYPVIASPTDGRLRESLQAEGIPVVVDPSINSMSSPGWLAYAEHFSMVILCTIVNVFAAKQLSDLGIPTIWWIHEAEASFHGAILNTAPYRLNDNVLICCGGPYARKKLLAHRPAYDVGILNYYVPDYLGKQTTHCYEIPDVNDCFVFAIVGTLLLRKGQDIFADAIKLMNQADRERCRFVLVGKYHNIDQQVYNSVQSVKKEYPKEVILIDELSREDLADVYTQIDCMVCASRDDPMPVFVTEAMMMSKICICSDNTGTAGLMQDGTDGFIYHNNSAEELAEKMTYVLHHADNMEILQRNARAVYEQNFSEKAFRSKFLPVIDNLCTGNINTARTYLSFPSNREPWKIGNEVHTKTTLPLISVIVPNYNHASYLRQRLDSIYGQIYSNFEVVLLDDYSTDESRDILNEYASRFQSNTRTAYNKINSGGVFRQWDKGIKLARGELIWIAESDDWCTENFLQELMPAFKYESVMLAFARTVFMRDGKQIWTTEEYLSDLRDLKWDRPFSMTAHQLVNRGFAIKNVIPNVSSVVFRNPRHFDEQEKSLWGGMRLCGDWIFYLHLIRGGRVCYTPQATNYYRIHTQSTSLNTQSTMRYYDEHQKVSEYVASHYRVDHLVFETMLRNLEVHFAETRKVTDTSPVKAHYRLDDIASAKNQRHPNIAIGVYSMQFGGGETFPVYLANELHNQGMAVTVIDFRMDKYDAKMRSLLAAGVPLIELADKAVLADHLEHLGTEIIHTHHLAADALVAETIKNKKLSCRHVITTHGSYEASPGGMAIQNLKKIAASCRNIVYTADKNLPIFTLISDVFRPDMFYKISNGLPKTDIIPDKRESYQIPDDAFVLCLVSRAIPEKGWFEAVTAVTLANEKSARPIHLLLVGEGAMYDDLKGNTPPYVHLLGFRSNLRALYAMSDMGFIPSRFKGESFPLVLIDCLFSGKPVLSSEIGEIRYQLTAKNNELAGLLFDLHDWNIPVKAVADLIVLAANDFALYEKLCTRVPTAAEKFNMNKVGREYLSVYRHAMDWDTADSGNRLFRLTELPAYDIEHFVDMRPDETSYLMELGKIDKSIQLYVDYPGTRNGRIIIDKNDRLISLVGWSAIPEPWRPMSEIWFAANGISIKSERLYRSDLSHFGNGMSNAGFVITLPTNLISHSNVIKLIAGYQDNDNKKLRYKIFDFAVYSD